MKIVNNSKGYITHVMFSVLSSSKYIPRHRGPYRGVFRYQLSLEIPPYNNTDKLYLAVWPNTSSHEFWDPSNCPEISNKPKLMKWYKGSDFLFDDTCVHEVLNDTLCRRIILFMDIERFDLPFYSKILHRLFMFLAKYLPVIKEAVEVQDKYLKTGNKIKPSINPYSNWELDNSPQLMPYRKWHSIFENQRNNNDDNSDDSDDKEEHSGKKD